MLKIKNLHAGYGKIKVLNGVEFVLEPGEIVALLGRNGSGRSTLCKAIMGLLKPTCGEVIKDSIPLTGKESHFIAKRGIGYIPENRDIFDNLTVEENLHIGMKKPSTGESAWSIDALLDTFPRLRERLKVKAGNLSGGEKQMLTMFRTLLGNPDYILVDEPTEGLAPKIVQGVGENIIEMKRRGLGVLMIEQKLDLALDVVDRVLVMGHGEIVFDGPVKNFIANKEIRREWLEVA